MKGELFAFTDWDIGRLADYPTVFSAGNVVTGKGNIVASRKHAREVSARAEAARIGERPGRIAERARERGERIADAIAVQPPITRERARRGARARAQAPAGGGLSAATTRPGCARARRPRMRCAVSSRLRSSRPVRSLPRAASRSASPWAPRFPQDRVAQIVPGQTTKDEILRLVRRARRVHRRRDLRAPDRRRRDRRGRPRGAAVRRHARLRDHRRERRGS